jgi:hypothetical protein
MASEKPIRAASNGAGYDDQNNNAVYEEFGYSEPDWGAFHHHKNSV